MKTFQENGSGLGKDSLKWAFHFNATLSDVDTTTVTKDENYLTPGEILKANGRSIVEFETEEEALADVQYLVEKNQRVHSWSNADFPPDVDTERPMYSQFYYIKDHGKRRQLAQTQKKELAGESALKGVKQLEQGFKFMEGLGMPGQLEGGATIESVKYGQMVKDAEDLKSTYLPHPTPHLDAWASASQDNLQPILGGWRFSLLGVPH